MECGKVRRRERERELVKTVIGNCISEASVTSKQMDEVSSTQQWRRGTVTTHLPEVTDSVGERSLCSDVCWIARIMVNLSNKIVNEGEEGSMEREEGELLFAERGRRRHKCLEGVAERASLFESNM